MINSERGGGDFVQGMHFSQSKMHVYFIVYRKKKRPGMSHFSFKIDKRYIINEDN